MDASIAHQEQKSWKEAMESLRSKSRLIRERHDAMAELLDSIAVNEHDESIKECKEPCEGGNKKEALPNDDNHNDDLKTSSKKVYDAKLTNDTQVSDDDIATDLSVCSAVTITPCKSPNVTKHKVKKHKRTFSHNEMIFQTLLKRVKRKYTFSRQSKEDKNFTLEFSNNDNNNKPRKRLRKLSTSPSLFSKSPIQSETSADIISLIEGDENEKKEDSFINVFDVDASFNKIEEKENSHTENSASGKDLNLCEVSSESLTDGVKVESNDVKKDDEEEKSSCEVNSETEQEQKEQSDEKNDCDNKSSPPSSPPFFIWSTKTEEHEDISSNNENSSDPNSFSSTDCQSSTPPTRKLTLDLSSDTDNSITKCNPIPDSDSEIVVKPLETPPVSKEIGSEETKRDEKSPFSALILPKNTNASNDETKNNWRLHGEQQQQQQPTIQVFYLVANKENDSLLQELKGIAAFSTTTNAATLDVSKGYETMNSEISVPSNTKPLLENSPYSQDLTLQYKKPKGGFGGFVGFVRWITSSVFSYFTILIIHFVISTFIREKFLK